MGADTVSLDPKYEETAWEHDRLFQKFSIENQIYPVPIDEEEEERQHVEDDVMNGVLEGKIFYAEIDDPSHVLDLGYGMGLWATAVAEKYSECEVTGVDIRPLDMLGFPQENLMLECDNLNRCLTEVYAPGTFDVIQSRLVGPGIHKNRWPSYLREIKSLLKPSGGLFQTAEYYFNIQSHSGQLTPNHALYQWGAKYRSAMERDRDPRVGTKMQQLCTSAGFSDIRSRYVELPIGDWSDVDKMKEVGLRNLDNMDKMFESFGLRPFMTRLNMTKAEVLDLCRACREEMRDANLRLYMPLYIVSARR